MATPNTNTAPSPSDQLPNVAHMHIEFQAMWPIWKRVADCVAGEDAVKAAGEKYLPKPTTNDGEDPKKVKERYNGYRTRALYYNATGRTLRGMVGEVFTRCPTTDLPQQLKDLLPNLDGEGRSAEQIAKELLSNLLQFGRTGLLVDYPNMSVKDETTGQVKVKQTTVKDLQEQKVRPRMVCYPPFSVINWRLSTYGALNLLSLVVLKEDNLLVDDGFEEVFNEQYRVLRLDAAGEYIVQIWRQPSKGAAFQMEEEFKPMANGKPFTRIPFTFVGSEDNGAKVNLPPLDALSSVNLSHYRNSAEYEDSVAIVGQPTLFICGMTEDWAKTVLKGKVRFGSRAVVPLEKGCTVELVQAEPNMIAKEAMDNKVQMMKALGAQLIEEKAVQRTATEAGQDSAANTSVLGTAARNVSDAMTAAFGWMAMYLGLDPKVGSEAGKELSYELSDDFSFKGMNPEQLSATVAAWQAELIDYEEARALAKRMGVAWKDDDEVKDANEAAREDLLGVRTVGGKLGNDPNIDENGNPKPPPVDPNKVPTRPPAKA